MSKKVSKDVIAEVSSIGKDAQALVAELQPKAQQGKDLTAAEKKKIAGLVKRSTEAMKAAETRAKKRRQDQIAELGKLLDSIKLSLGTPGLSETAIKDLKQLRRNTRAKLVRLETRAGLDFGGILSAAEIKAIEAVLKEAKNAVERKKKVAAFLGSLIKVANLAISIVGKAGSLA